MKKTTFKLIIVALCSLYFSNAEAQDSTTPHKAIITFENSIHDYDTIVQGANGDCIFRFTNTGDAPLLISDVNASCGCTKPRWDKKPVLPGKSGVIHVTYNTMLTGHFRKTLVVRTNAANGNNQVLRIKGFVRKRKP